MSVPDPATTNWVPLQGRPSGAAYFGQYQASGHTYYDGDCVIGSDGILYMCVTDGTTTPPVAWPGASAPQGVAGPQGPAGVGIPSPVVNGSWIKGVSGAAVWTPLTQDQLPTNLGATEPALPGSDYNQATAAGWYVGTPTDANRPPSNMYAHVQVFQFGGPQYKQIAHRYDSLDRWERLYIGGVGWTIWNQTQFTPDRNWISIASNPGYVNGFVDYGVPYGPAMYRKLASGLVIFKGLISAPGPGLAFTMPAGYRILTGSTNYIFHAASSANLATETWRIDGNGAMVYSNASAWVSVAGIQYYAES
jgi:hypothetical protein